MENCKTIGSHNLIYLCMLKYQNNMDNLSKHHIYEHKDYDICLYNWWVGGDNEYMG